MLLARNPLFEIDDRFAGLIFLALDHAIDSIKEGGPLVPFLFHEGPAGERNRALARYDASFYEESVLRARFAAAALPNSVETCVLAFDGFITVEGIKSDAILVEASQRGRPKGLVFAQRYQPAHGPEVLRKIGNAAFLGECESLFNLPS